MNLNSKLVLFDIDGTITDINLSKLKAQIQYYEQLGVVFGLNTNRPLKDCSDIYKELDLNGPMIVEDGSFYKLKEDDALGYDADGAVRINDRTIELLKRNEIYGGILADVIVTADKSILEDQQAGSLILITPDRNYTSSVYVRSGGRIEEKMTDAVFKYLDKAFLSEGISVRIKKVSEFGKIIISGKATNRIKTLQEVAYKYFNKYDILVVSDFEPISDFEFSNIVFSSVKNGEIAYKTRSKIVATKEGEDGIIEILNIFLKH